MHWRWSIQTKLLLCVALLLAMVVVLAVSGFQGAYSYRTLVRTMSLRASELPVAGELAQSLGDMRVTLSRANSVNYLLTERNGPEVDNVMLQHEFRTEYLAVEETLRRYGKQLTNDFDTDPRLGDRSKEREILATLERKLEVLAKAKDDPDWVVDPVGISSVATTVDEMYDLAGILPAQLHDRMRQFGGDVKDEYRTWIITSWIMFFLAIGMMVVLLAMFYVWVVAPLHVLLAGSRRIAKADDFNHRIFLRTNDEFSELAGALNDMTSRFQEIRHDLDDQVRQRTQEVVRSEQMASVGFLAAGVAHEINNPLAAIAMAAESLESRVEDIIVADGDKPSEEQNAEIAVLSKYLRRIQDEAFRCKGITDQLLDFSRRGPAEKDDTDLGELAEGVIDMVRHLGNYKQKNVELVRADEVRSRVNGQEIKQVLLNLITNGLDSLDNGGTVKVELRRSGQWAEIVVSDNGCGMSPEVLKHLFEPFFTRRRDGQGTGLGLSITYRIVSEHGGTIEVFSDGPGKGSRMRVLFPLSVDLKATHERALQNGFGQRRYAAA
ncbi:Sensor protein ZraS [Anatilimnocola aggregata]|uniref:histidine kinase n=1 Tax=Anatilimnocola aggregata TaxID=2528021 RepID=A0A517YL77_9BACT|nr:HAMP domain-containing sensor histidine kinase [Anatilimnocola aggregata]QDU30964.1 Sensor protein ZraS [Anatilimnocola aggregata]